MFIHTKKKIVEKDEEFFMNNNYDKGADTSRPDIVKIIMNLKNIGMRLVKKIVILFGFIFKL